jgi:hypothetical protein
MTGPVPVFGVVVTGWVALITGVVEVITGAVEAGIVEVGSVEEVVVGTFLDVAGGVAGVVLELTLVLGALLHADDIAREARAAPPIMMPAFFRNSLRDKPLGLFWFSFSMWVTFQIRHRVLLEMTYTLSFNIICAFTNYL